MKRTFALVLVLGTVQLLNAQVSHRFPTLPKTLQPGISLQILLSGVPAEEGDKLKSQSFTVSANGSVTLPYVGEVKMDGLTPAQAERTIEAAYVAGEIFRFPTITILPPPSSSGRQPAAPPQWPGSWLSRVHKAVACCLG